MIIGSTKPGGGALAVRFDFSTPFRLAFSGTVGRLATYSGTDPGFDAVVGDRPFKGLFALRPGVEIRLELVDNDFARAAVKLGESRLTRPGDTATLGRMGRGGAGSLHTHPEFQLLLRTDESRYGEAHLGVRLHSADGTYAPSPVYRLFLTNGFLQPVVYGGTYTPAALRCRRVLARAVRDVVSDELALALGMGSPPAEHAPALGRMLRACGPQGAAIYDERELQALVELIRQRIASLTRTAAATSSTCRSVIGVPLTTILRGASSAFESCLLRAEAARARAEAALAVAPGLVESACGGHDGSRPIHATPLARIMRDRARAQARIVRGCGEDVPARPLVRDAQCVAAEILSAVHPGAKEDLAAFTAWRSQGGRPLADYLPCLRGGTTHVHDHDHRH